MNIIEEVIRLYSESESPTSYFYWSTLAALSAVARRNVWVNKRGVYKLYPCMYIMLVGKSGIMKGLPVKVAKRLVEATGTTRTFSGRMSIEAMIEDLGHQKTSPSGIVFNTGECFIANDELGAMLVKNSQAQLLLTQLYDSFYHEEWTYRTLRGNDVIIKKPGLTLLTATNKAHLDQFLDPDSIIGGFIGRTNLVYADKGSETGNDLFGETDEEDDLIEEIKIDHIIEHLKCVSALEGRFSAETSARKLWKNWRKEIKTAINSSQIDDDTGTIQRIHDNALRLAMLLSLAERLDKVITLSHMEEAILKSEESFHVVKLITNGKGKADDSDKTRILLEYLLEQENFSASRQKILKSKWKDIDGISLTKIIDTIGPTGARIISVRNTNDGVIYSIDDKYANQFKVKMNKGRVIVQ